MSTGQRDPIPGRRLLAGVNGTTVSWLQGQPLVERPRAPQSGGERQSCLSGWTEGLQRSAPWKQRPVWRKLSQTLAIETKAHGVNAASR